MKNGGQAIAEGDGQMLPVFRGLADARIPGNVMAGIVGVAAPTYSKWRTGKSKIPAATLVFMTLLLANRIEEIQEEGAKSLRFEATLKVIHRHLRQQEMINGTLHPGAMREGARLFRQWWQKTSGQRPTETGPDPLGTISPAMIYPAHMAAYNRARSDKSQPVDGAS